MITRSCLGSHIIGHTPLTMNRNHRLAIVHIIPTLTLRALRIPRLAQARVIPPLTLRAVVETNIARSVSDSVWGGGITARKMFCSGVKFENFVFKRKRFTRNLSGDFVPAAQTRRLRSGLFES